MRKSIFPTFEEIDNGTKSFTEHYYRTVKGKKVRNIPCTLVLVANATMDFAGNGKTGLYVSNDGSQLAKDVPRKRKGRSPQMERQFLHFQQPS